MCGIACLKMVCKYHGNDLSMERLSQICRATAEGVSLLGISDAANELGLHAIAVRIGASRLIKAPMPCILHWNQNHCTILRSSRVLGSAMRSNGEEKGIAMFLEPTPSFFPTRKTVRVKRIRIHGRSVFSSAM